MSLITTVFPCTSEAVLLLTVKSDEAREAILDIQNELQGRHWDVVAEIHQIEGHEVVWFPGNWGAGYIDGVWISGAELDAHTVIMPRDLPEIYRVAGGDEERFHFAYSVLFCMDEAA